MPSKTARWRQISRLYHGALARSGQERAIFLSTECAGDDSVRRDVEALLASEAAAQTFLESPAIEVAARILPPSDGAMSLVGRQIGPFLVKTLIGAGGMGEVYRARDTKLNRDVAMKVLPDVFASDLERLARFQREARTLAGLNHPHIAHIHGFEEANGVAAIVMETVEGQISLHASHAVRCHWMKHSPSRVRLPKRSRRRTHMESSTVISSRRTSKCETTAW